MTTYKIVRFYQHPDKPSRTVMRGLTLEQAKAHCADPETSSRTCKRPAAMRITTRNGPWFDSYTEE